MLAFASIIAHHALYIPKPIGTAIGYCYGNDAVESIHRYTRPIRSLDTRLMTRIRTMQAVFRVMAHFKLYSNIYHDYRLII